MSADPYLVARILRKVEADRDALAARAAHLEEALRALNLADLPPAVYSDEWSEAVGVYLMPWQLRKARAALSVDA